MKNLEKIQQELQKANLDGWLLLDFRGSNSIAWDIVQMPSTMHCTRRWAVFIPAHGHISSLVHAIEDFTLAHLEAHQTIYSGYKGWYSGLQTILLHSKRIAIEYSPLCAIPTASKVDAGTVDLLRELGKDVISSADLLQSISAVWSTEQLEENLQYTAPTLGSIMNETFDFIQTEITKQNSIDEYTVQQFIVKRFKDHNLYTYSDPIVARDINAASPHYAPSKDQSSSFGRDTTVLIDMWACPSHGKGTYSDITWMCRTGSSMPEDHSEVFSTLIQARNAGIALINERFKQQQMLAGFEVDDVVRGVIQSNGFGDYFVHRTGHSITTETHGPGANMDNFETHDTRHIIPMTSFSIEPGIYIPHSVGMRTEIDMVILPNGEPIVSGLPQQEEMVYLF